MRAPRKLIVAAAVALSLAAVPAARAATLVADYTFGGTLGSVSGSAPPILPVGPPGGGFPPKTVGGCAKPVYGFAVGAGLRVDTGAVQGNNWSGIVQFRLNEVSGDRRVIALDAPARVDPASDARLYVEDGKVVYYSGSGNLPNPTGTPILPGRYYEVAVTRANADNRGAVYGDGKPELDYTTSGSGANISDEIGSAH